MLKFLAIMLMLDTQKNLTIMREKRHYYAPLCSNKKANIYPYSAVTLVILKHKRRL